MLGYFRNTAHAGWPDTKTYRLPPSVPILDHRVDGPVSRVAGIVEREVGTPLARRRLNEVVVGTAGRPGTSVFCSAAPGMNPVAFSPDETGLGLFDGQDTWYVELGGVHAVTRLVHGQVLAWRA